jgi:hypothetical protein
MQNQRPCRSHHLPRTNIQHRFEISRLSAPESPRISGDSARGCKQRPTGFRQSVLSKRGTADVLRDLLATGQILRVQALLAAQLKGQEGICASSLTLGLDEWEYYN